MRLRALHPALAEQGARTDGDRRLNDVKAFAQRIGGWVDQG